MVLDHDSKFSTDVIAFLECTGLKPKRTSVQAPWRNGIADRWVGSCRRELLDHVIPLSEEHLRRLVRDPRDWDTEKNRGVSTTSCPIPLSGFAGHSVVENALHMRKTCIRHLLTRPKTH